MGVDGIGAAQVDHKAGQAVVTYDSSKVKPDAISKTISDLGFQATVAPASKG
ncbi:cation transporter [Myxococcota bacterium]|nr:cation transporter [Myxococcota bacterium]